MSPVQWLITNQPMNEAEGSLFCYGEHGIFNSGLNVQKEKWKGGASTDRLNAMEA